MKRYEFDFTTKITFDLPIINHNFVLKCLPKDTVFQRIYDIKITLEPECSYSIGEDSFGNKTINGTINKEHNKFAFSVKGKVLASHYKLMEDLEKIYLYESSGTKASDEIIQFFKGIPLTGNIKNDVSAICEMVYNYMTYTPNSTDILTTAAEAFDKKQGVCQDYAHIAITLLKLAKIPARYCDGFIEGEGETHAWIEYYDNGIWYGFDPTHNKAVDYGYIKLGQGRDSYDCSVERGCFACKKGIVTQNSEIMVKVGEIYDN